MSGVKRYVLATMLFAAFAGHGVSATIGGITNGMVTPAQGSSIAYQEGIVNDLAAGAARGVSSGTVHRIIIDSTGGTLVPAMIEASASDAGNRQVFGNLLSGTNVSGAALTPAQVVSDLRSVAGQRAASGPGVQTGMATVGGIQQTIGNRLFSLKAERRSLIERFGSDSALASSIMNADLCNRIWASGFYLHDKMDEKDGYAPYKYEAYGASVGLDRAFGAMTLGAAFTYSRGDVGETGVRDDNTIDNYGGSAYAEFYSQSGFFLNVSGGYNYAKNDMKTWFNTTNTWYEGENHTDSFWGVGKLGYDFHLTENLVLTPSAGIMYTHAKGSEYSARAGAFSQRVGKMSNKSWVLPVELTASYVMLLDDCSALTLSASGGYSHNFTNEGVTGKVYQGQHLGALPVAVQGVAPGRHGWNAGVGLKYERNRFDIGVDYRYEGRDKFDRHRIAASIGLNF